MQIHDNHKNVKIEKNAPSLLSFVCVEQYTYQNAVVVSRKSAQSDNKVLLKKAMMYANYMQISQLSCICMQHHKDCVWHLSCSYM